MISSDREIIENFNFDKKVNLDTEINITPDEHTNVDK